MPIGLQTWKLDQELISGYVITMAGGAVAWSSKKQNTVAHSTAEAEYIATTHTYSQTSSVASIFIRRTRLTNSYYSTSTIFSDNEAAISILHHPEFHPRTKHIDINYHFLRNLVESTIIDVVYIKTDGNLADILTKGLPKSAHGNVSYELGL